MRMSLVVLSLFSRLLGTTTQLWVNPGGVITKPVPTITKMRTAMRTTPKPQSPYCQPRLCVKGHKHVACESYYNSFQRTCTAKGPTFVNFTNLAEKIVKMHNERRFLLASGKDAALPRAARMVAMQWDEELAEVAAFNARMCQAKHDECRNTVKYPRSGQNIIVFNLTRLVEKSLIEKLYPQLLSIAGKIWWSESEKLTADDLDLYPCSERKQKAYRHFAVMAVEGNSHVGCAGLRYVVGNMTQFKLTCNYARAPVCGQPIYRFHPLGCQTGRDKKHSSLCSPMELFR
ncbi:antigen 5 like allergen Cul n 1-like [Drosophila ficusphila]|uniref:antigen 5 like allergen Cul n 1-like n=1 Tax=Drosophila ficusphila TaxID=30025 RepID=UPI0007E6BA4B|nr:antigen 5 like allergen Cul n 1-like [Drosophila ficusphila]